MAIQVTHPFVSAVADAGDATKVQPSNWNADHTLSMATARLLGRTTAGAGAVEEISVGAGLTLAAGVLNTAAAGGDVVGPASSVDNQLARYSGITGKLLDAVTGVTLSDAGVLQLPQGSKTAPSYIMGTASNGFYDLGGVWGFAQSGVARLVFANTIKNTVQGGYDWVNNSDASTGTVDTGLWRNAAGVVEVNNGTAAAYRDMKVRQHYVDQTITAGGTTGAQTINKAAGTVNFAAAAVTLVVTNSLCTTSSTVYCSVRTNDSTALIKNAVPAAGSFTITLNAAATAETSVGFLVIN